MPKKMVNYEKQIGVRVSARMIRGMELLVEREEFNSVSDGGREAIKDLLIKYGVWKETANMENENNDSQ